MPVTVQNIKFKHFLQVFVSQYLALTLNDGSSILPYTFHPSFVPYIYNIMVIVMQILMDNHRQRSKQTVSYRIITEQWTIYN